MQGVGRTDPIMVVLSIHDEHWDRSEPRVLKLPKERIARYDIRKPRIEWIGTTSFRVTLRLFDDKNGNVFGYTLTYGLG